jgi:hypothetical protein
MESFLSDLRYYHTLTVCISCPNKRIGIGTETVAIGSRSGVIKIRSAWFISGEIQFRSDPDQEGSRSGEIKIRLLYSDSLNRVKCWNLPQIFIISLGSPSTFVLQSSMGHRRDIVYLLYTVHYSIELTNLVHKPCSKFPRWMCVI